MSRRRDHRVRDDLTHCPDSAGCVRLYHGELGGPEVGDVCECCGQEVTEDPLSPTEVLQELLNSLPAKHAERPGIIRSIEVLRHEGYGK